MSSGRFSAGPQTANQDEEKRPRWRTMNHAHGPPRCEPNTERLERNGDAIGLLLIAHGQRGTDNDELVPDVKPLIAKHLHRVLLQSLAPALHDRI